jgi:uracil-DNA glycosylase family 4
VSTWGDPASPVLLVGEAPGAKEVVDGRPFAGRAGDELRAALAAVSRSEADVFIVNTVACKPYPKVKPTSAAIRACRERLIHEIERAPRAAIVTLGATAFAALTGRRGLRMLDVRGTPVETQWGTVVPTLHPARVLRIRTERDYLVHDLRLAFEIAGSGSEN